MAGFVLVLLVLLLAASAITIVYGDHPWATRSIRLPEIVRRTFEPVPDRLPDMVDREGHEQRLRALNIAGLLSDHQLAELIRPGAGQPSDNAR